MVSTYLAYNSIVRNLKQSMTRVAQQPDVSRKCRLLQGTTSAR